MSLSFSVQLQSIPICKPAESSITTEATANVIKNHRDEYNDKKPKNDEKSVRYFGNE